MNNFTFYSPTFFVFGKDKEDEAGKYVRRFGGTKELPDLDRYARELLKVNGAFSCFQT